MLAVVRVTNAGQCRVWREVVGRRCLVELQFIVPLDPPASTGFVRLPRWRRWQVSTRENQLEQLVSHRCSDDVRQRGVRGGQRMHQAAQCLIQPCDVGRSVGARDQ